MTDTQKQTRTNFIIAGAIIGIMVILYFAVLKPMHA